MVKEKKQIKEDRYILDPDKVVAPKVDVPKKDKKDKEGKPEKKDEFDARAGQYWNDMEGLMVLLNKANPKIEITDSSSPHILNYLLWRLLVETKNVKFSTQKLSKSINELKLNFKVLAGGV